MKQSVAVVKGREKVANGLALGKDTWTCVKLEKNKLVKLLLNC